MIVVGKFTRSEMTKGFQIT